MIKLPQTKSLYGDRKKINMCRKVGLPLHNPQGEWNGYGYKRLALVVTLSTIGEVRKFKKICKDCKELEKEKAAKKTRSPQEKIESWCKRLSLLSGISTEEARKIAQEKIDYFDRNIEKRFSSAQAYEPRGGNARYPAWVRQAEKDYSKFYEDESSALRRITNEQHAHAILSASNRHNNTDYESRLEEGKELAFIGDIEKSEVRDYARSNL
jgi:hypothetical protein